MATQDQINDLASLYAGYFNRAADPAGLQFWIDQIDAGRAFNTIAADFAASPEAEALYPYLVTPGVSNPTDFITSIYENLFNRAPDAAGLSFWSGVLADGTVSVADFIEAIINGAVDDPAEGTFDATTLSNKIEVSLDFADKTSNEPGFTYDAAAAAAAVAVLDGVTYDPATVVEGKLEVDEFLHPSTETFTLTTGVDSGPEFTGGTTDAVFNAHLGLGIDGLVGVQTLQGPDVLDGGAGFNILNAELNGTGTTANPTISNIQQYNLTTFDLGGNGALDLTRATGYEQLWNRDSRSDLSLINVGEVAILGLDNVSEGAEYRVNYDGIAVETQTVVAMHTGREAESDVTLDITGVDGVIGTLNLVVSDGVYLALEHDANLVENLIITGDGELRLSGDDLFPVLETLDTLGYDGDVNLDISGSGTVTSVLTGDGDDMIAMSAASFSADTSPTSVDLGMGDNSLILVDNFETTPDGTYTGGGLIDSGELSALDFTLAPVMNVQTLELVDVDLGGDASLDLDGVGGLETLVFSDFDNGGGDDLLIENAPQVLAINATTNGPSANDAQFEMNGGLLTVDGVVNLTMNAGDDLRLDGGLEGDALETLVMNGGGDVVLNADQGLDALTSIEVNALGTSDSVFTSNANVNLTAEPVVPAHVPDLTLDALKNVNVTAANNATLTMTGQAGVAFVAGTQATQSFTIDVTGGASSGFPFFARTAAGNVFLTSGSLTAGFIDINYSDTQLVSTAANPDLDTGAASDLAAALDATSELAATNTGNLVNVTWEDVGDGAVPLSYQAGSSGGSTGTLDGITPVAFVDGTNTIDMIAGQGFEAVETVTVDAQDGDANVNLTDVYGAFTLDVTATDDANVTLLNTNATSVTVAAGMDSITDMAHVEIGGDTIGALSLVDLTVSGNTAGVTLWGNIGSTGGMGAAGFTTLDVSNVVTHLEVDTSAADFGAQASGTFVEYAIGATSDGLAGVDVDFTGNTDAREVYNFVGADIGEVEVNDFTWGADPATGDRLDLSAFALNAGELVFTDVGGDLVITDLAGGSNDFDGSITIVGGAGHAADLASFNIIYG